MATKKLREEPQDLGEGLTARVMEVTPEIATRWLEKNHGRNRGVSDTIVEKLSTDMRSGNWRLTHQGICFDADGTLIDGQHRLWAIVTSGCSIKILVVGNDHGSLSDPIDTVRNRSTGFLIGEKQNVVAAANVLRYLEHGYKTKSAQTAASATETIARHREHLDAIRQLPRCHSIPGHILGALAYARPIDPEKIDALATQIQTGEMIQAGDPAYALRQWIHNTGKGANTWEKALATLAVARYAIQGVRMRAVFVAEFSYRGITTQRRTRKIPHTPDASLVPTSTWAIKTGEGVGEPRT